MRTVTYGGAVSLDGLPSIGCTSARTCGQHILWLVRTRRRRSLNQFGNSEQRP